MVPTARMLPSFSIIPVATSLLTEKAPNGPLQRQLRSVVQGRIDLLVTGKRANKRRGDGLRVHAFLSAAEVEERGERTALQTMG